MKIINIIFLLVISSYAFTLCAGNNMYGGRTEQSIQSAFKPLLKPVFELYQKELALNPKLRGKADFSIKVSNSGKVKACRAEVTESLIENLADNICELIGEINLGEGEEFELVYPINFYPE